MGENHDEVVADIKAMQVAIEAISSIPTARRRQLAFDWITERVNADLTRLRSDEHIERVADAVSYVLGEP